jgi:hypothetical protein
LELRRVGPDSRSQSRRDLLCESARSFSDTEEFIENLFPVDIGHSVTIDCEVTQNGWRPTLLRMMLDEGTPLLANKSLHFKITECRVPKPYEVKWKVLNQGDEAERRNNIRGQIISSSRPGVRHERTVFRGEHVVECYIVKDGIVVARDIIDVPISPNGA